MKCIYCATDAKLRERTSGMCPACGKPFALEPTKGDLLTDVAFQSAINAESATGQVRWGVEHLYYELCRRRWKRRWFFMRYFAGPTVRMDQATFDALWSKWRSAHGEPKGLIVRKPSKPSARPQESDIGDYSFDRAVICDRARTVDLLIANNFHFENNCAILSIGGYPEGPFDTVRTMLKRNPKLQVFAIHDATVPGCKLAHTLASDATWFKGQVAVTDVGLHPAQAGRFRGLYLPGPSLQIVRPGEGIRPADVAWLSEYALELAAIRPEQILKRLFKAINRREDAAHASADATSAGGDGGSSGSSSDADSFAGDAFGGGQSGGAGGGSSYSDDTSFSADAGDSDGGADSFG